MTGKTDRLKWIRRGTWEPLIPYPFRGIIMLGWVILPIPYGIDYLNEDVTPSSRYSIVETAMPLFTWGLLMIFAGIAASASLVLRWRLRAVVSLHVLGATWLTLSIGLLADSIENQGGDGFRGAALFFVVSITYWSSAIGYYCQREDDDDDEDREATDADAGDPETRIVLKDDK